jgi:hypothetical protein
MAGWLDGWMAGWLAGRLDGWMGEKGLVSHLLMVLLSLGLFFKLRAIFAWGYLLGGALRS